VLVLEVYYFNRPLTIQQKKNVYLRFSYKIFHKSMHSLDYGLPLSYKQMFKLPPPLPKSRNLPTTISATSVRPQRKELTSALKIRRVKTR